MPAPAPTAISTRQPTPPLARQALYEEVAERLRGRQLRQRDAFFASNEAFRLKLLDVAGNRWRQQIVADLRKVMNG